MKCVVEHEKLNRVPGKEEEEEVNGLKDHRKREKEKSSGSLSLVNDPRFLPLTLLLCYWSCHYNQGRINEGKVNSREDLFLLLRQKITEKIRVVVKQDPESRTGREGWRRIRKKKVWVSFASWCITNHHFSWRLKRKNVPLSDPSCVSDRKWRSIRNSIWAADATRRNKKMESEEGWGRET